MRVLVVNAGSSSLKLRLLGPDDAVVATHDAEGSPEHGLDPASVDWLGSVGEVDAVGHRIVHGGRRYRSAVLVDDAVRTGLADLASLAPLHQPKSLAALEAVSAALPDVPAVACFDTAFHATLAPEAATYAVPARWRERWGVRRYGFHGLSHAYAARRAPLVLGRPVTRLVSCHLGAGASVTAVRDGRSVDTSMGFTPLEGVVMATRSGSVDPGLLLWLLEREHVDEREMAETLERRSGLLSLAGTADMRVVIARAEAGEPDATLALGVYVHRLRATIGAMAATLGGLDALLFTGGVGERAPRVRALVAEGLGFLGVALDAGMNEGRADDVDVAAAGSVVGVPVVTAREDLEIAAQVRALLGVPH